MENEIILKVTSYLNNNMAMPCNSNEVRIFCEPNALISQNFYESQRTFMRESPRLLEVFYGKSNSDEIRDKCTSLWREVQKKIKSISEKEIIIIFERIIDGKTAVSKFWNISELLLVFKDVERARKTARDKYFSLLKYQNESEDEKKKQIDFLNQSLMKFNNDEILNVYEKSVIGFHYEGRILNSSELKILAEQNLEKMQMELKAKQELREKISPLGIGFGDLKEFPDEPMFWNLKLVWSNYLFNALQ